MYRRLKRSFQGKQYYLCGILAAAITCYVSAPSSYAQQCTAAATCVLWSQDPNCLSRFCERVYPESGNYSYWEIGGTNASFPDCATSPDAEYYCSDRNDQSVCRFERHCQDVDCFICTGPIWTFKYRASPNCPNCPTTTEDDPVDGRPGP
jgi:hypothetical protein